MLAKDLNARVSKNMGQCNKKAKTVRVGSTDIYKKHGVGRRKWFKSKYRCRFGIRVGIAGQANRESHVLRKLLGLHLATL